jgi:hypothetical protein
VYIAALTGWSRRGDERTVALDNTAGQAGGLRSNRRAAWAVFFCFFGLYLLSTSRERPWTDAKAIHQVAENLVAQRSFHINVVWPPDSPAGRLGKHYAVNPLLTSLVHVPGAMLNRIITRAAPQVGGLSLALTSHLAGAALGALTCALLFLLCCELGLSLAAASLTTIVCGLATSIWVYARYPYSEILQAACFTGFVRAVVAVPAARRTHMAALAVGLWGGALVNAKLVFGLSVIAAAAQLGWHLRRDRPRLLRAGGFLGLGLVPGAVMAMFYNWVRWGSPLRSGYSPFLDEFFGHGQLSMGLQGLFLSPGTSVFLYSPPLVLALAGIGEAWRRRRFTMVAIAATAVPVILLYGSYAFWQGGWNWGPRYLVFVLPLFLLPLGFLFERMRAAGRRWLLWAAFGVAMVAGGMVQVAGNAFYWDHYIRIAEDARLRWLGTPDRRGSVPPDAGGNCHACFEDMYATNWLPPFSPVAGHFWLLRHVPFDHDWKEAEKDAPWRRFTSLSLDIHAVYPRARIDWWGLDYTGRRGARALLFGAMLLIAAAGAGLWVWELRKRTTAAAELPAG